MGLPPHSFGDRRGHVVALVRRPDGDWSGRVDGRLLAGAFRSEDAARAAAGREALRLDASAQALLARVRRGLRRKQR